MYTGKPDWANCNKCTKTYGTLGCCTTDSNEWVYSCLEGMIEHAYQEGFKDGQERAEPVRHGIMHYEHDGRVLARIKDKTMSVKTDEHGLFIEIVGDSAGELIAWMEAIKQKIYDEIDEKRAELKELIIKRDALVKYFCVEQEGEENDKN